MELDNVLTHIPFDSDSINQKDYFADSDDHTSRVQLPNNLRYLAVNDLRVNIPPQLAGSLLCKALHHLLHHTGLSIISQDGYFQTIRRILNYLSANPTSYDVKDPKFVLQVVSNAIKDLVVSDRTAYDFQTVFLNAIRKINGKPNFTIAEQKLSRAILKHTVVFKQVKSEEKKPLSVLYPGFSDSQYIDSIRSIVLKYHAVWSEIRAQFKSKMPSEHSELKERLITIPGLFNLLASNTPSMSSFNKGGSNYGSPLKGDVVWIRNLFIDVAKTLENEHFTEALYLSIIYAQLTLSSEFIVQQKDRLTLKSQIDHPAMLSHLSTWLSMRVCRVNGKKTTINSVFSPLVLLLPWGGNELGLYSTFLLTERLAPTSVRNISLDQFTWLDRNNIETKKELASRATIRNIYKVRQKKITDLEITDRGKQLFNLLYELYSSYKIAMDEGLIDQSFNQPFQKLFSEKGQALSSQLLSNGLFKQSIANSGLVPLVVAGTALYSNIQQLNEPAFHELMIASSQRGSSNGRKRINPDLPKWRSSRGHIASTSISQSRIMADLVVDLSDTRVSDDMTFKYSEEFYKKAQQQADAQFHSLETRLNVYYQRAQTKLIVEVRESFAARVGDEMVKMAMEMAIFAGKSNSVITLEQAKTVCGLGDVELEITPEELISLADAQDALIDDTAFITPSKGSMTYIIKSDLHAFLMVAKIHHIDASINDLLMSNERLVPRAIARRMLLMMLLSEFEKPMVSRANKRLKTMLKRESSALSNLFPSLNVRLGDDQ